MSKTPDTFLTSLQELSEARRGLDAASERLDATVASMAIGIATDSAILGGLIGGSLTGGIVGDLLNGGDL